MESEEQMKRAGVMTGTWGGDGAAYSYNVSVNGSWVCVEDVKY
jgi:hypothetical protein